MNTFFSRLITVVACFFIFSAAWFCLWSISLHLVERPELAALLFPFGLRLGLMLQCPRGYWPGIAGRGVAAGVLVGAGSRAGPSAAFDAR